MQSFNQSIHQSRINQTIIQSMKHCHGQTTTPGGNTNNDNNNDDDDNNNDNDNWTKKKKTNLSEI